MNIQIVKSLLWPPASPPAMGIGKPNDGPWWASTCTLLVLPLTAIAHNAVFYPNQCMLEAFAGDYSHPGALLWLSRDPSLPWSILIAFVTFQVGNRFQSVKVFAACFMVSFLPLALWIWDIPFTGRFICIHAHDNRLKLLGWPVTSKYFYLLGAFLFGIFLFAMLRKETLRRSFLK